MGIAVLLGAVILAAVLLHKPDEAVVVLPGPDGKAGTVVVERGSDRVVLDQPYASNQTATDRMQVSILDADEVRKTFGSTVAALPARPLSFVLLFVSGTDEMTDASKEELQKVLAALKERPSPDVVVIGHTDTVGDLATNDALSVQRAERVKGYLVEIGIPASRIKTAGRGKREPLVPSADNVDEPLNRRVEINVR